MKRDLIMVDNYTKAYLVMWTATRYTGDGELAYGFVEKVCKTLNVVWAYATR
jgi:putative DNA methylase